MKLIIVIVRDEESEDILHGLVQKKFRVTKIASTGGFLRKGMTTLMVGVEDDLVDQAINIVEEKCTPAIEPGLRCATLFVLNVDQYVQV